MKKMFAVFALMLLSACSIAPQLATQRATSEILKVHPDWADKMISITDSLISMTESGEVTTLSALQAAVNAKLDTLGLNEVDRADIDLLVGAATEQMHGELKQSNVAEPGKELIVIKKFLTWIRDRAKAYKKA